MMFHARQQLSGIRIYVVSPLGLGRDLDRVGVKFSCYLGTNLFVVFGALFEFQRSPHLCRFPLTSITGCFILSAALDTAEELH